MPCRGADRERVLRLRQAPSASAGTTQAPSASAGTFRHPKRAPADTSPKRQHGADSSLAVVSGVFSLIIPHIQDRLSEARFIVKPALAPALCPPLDAHRLGRIGVAPPLQFLQVPSAPRLELVPDDLGRSPGGDDDMHMVGATVDDVQMPAAECAMFGDGFF